MTPTDGFKREKILVKKVEEIIEDNLQLERFPADQMLQKLVIFASLNDSGENQEYAFSIIKNCSPEELKEFSKKISKWPIEYRLLFFQALVKQIIEKGDKEVLLTAWFYQLSVLEREPLELLQCLQDLLRAWTEYILSSRLLLSNAMAKCVNALRKIFMKNKSIEGGERLSFLLLKNIHSARLKIATLDNTQTDLMAYLEFLRDVEIAPEKPLKTYIEENDLYLGRGDLKFLIDLYSEIKTQKFCLDKLYNKANIIRDLSVLNKINRREDMDSPEELMLSLCLGIHSCKYRMEDLFQFCDKLTSSFDRNSLPFVRVFSDFYHFTWVDFHKMCRGNEELMRFCLPIVLLTDQVLKNCLEECEECEISTVDQKFVFLQFFKALYIIYISGFFEVGSFYLDSLQKAGLTFDPIKLLLDLAIKMLRNDEMFFYKLLVIEEDLENGWKAHELESKIGSVHFRLKFFNQLQENLPENRQGLKDALRKHIKSINKELEQFK